MLESHDQPNGPLQIIGGLGGLVTALSAYVYSLRAKLSRKNGEVVSLRKAIEEILDERLSMFTIEVDRRMKAIVEEAAVLHETKTEEHFNSVERRLARLENFRLEDKRDMFDQLLEMQRQLGQLSGDVKSLHGSR